MTNRILYNIKRCIQLACLPLKMGKYLKHGVYKYNTSVTILYPVKNLRHKNPQVFGAIEENGNIFRKLFSKLYCYINCFSKSEFKGDYMVVTSSEREFKFFNHQENLLLTNYSSLEKLEFVYQQRTYWAEWFPTVSCTKDTREKTILEPLVNTKPFQSDCAFRQLLNDYAKYLKESSRGKAIEYYKPNYSYLNKFCALWGDTSFRTNLQQFLEDNPVPLFRTHGDLWKSNMLFDGEKFYYIDFEQTGERPFFYDIFMYFVSDAFVLHDRYLLNKFISGEFDVLIRQISESLNYKFDNTKRRLYLSLFVFELFCNRWIGTKDENMVTAVYDLITTNE